MHGTESQTSLPELGFKHPNGCPNIAKLAAVVGAAVLSGQAAGAADTGKTEAKRSANAIASATIVRPFELTIPKDGDDSAEARSTGPISSSNSIRTEFIRDCTVLLGSDAGAVRTELCRLYVIELQ